MSARYVAGILTVLAVAMLLLFGYAMLSLPTHGETPNGWQVITLLTALVAAGALGFSAMLLYDLGDER